LSYLAIVIGALILLLLNWRRIRALQVFQNLFGSNESTNSPSREYNYIDPNFGRPPLEPVENLSGVVVGENGDAIYGNNKRYQRDLYYGRVSKGANLKLLDLRVYKNQYESLIFVTSFHELYDSQSGLIQVQQP